MSRTIVIAFAVYCAVCGRARAHDEVPLGQPGQWLLSGSVGASARWETWEQPPGAMPALVGVDRLCLWVTPVVRMFVVTDFAVGAYIVVDLQRYDRDDGIELAADGFGGGASLSYRIGLGGKVFLLPELSAGAVYYHRTAESSRGIVWRGTGLSPEIFLILARQRFEAPWMSATVVQAALSLPFALVLAPRFYAGLGPYLRVNHANHVATPRGDDWDIVLGITTIFGSWL